MRTKIRTAALVLATTFWLTGSASASTITFNFNAPTVTGIGTHALGQSVTTPAGGPWTNITFNFFDHQANPFASGALFLLTQAPAGTAPGLSNASPGFLASTSTISGGKWVFGPGVTLQPGTAYWFLMGSYSGPAFALFAGTDPYAAGTAWLDFSGTGYAPLSGVDWGFIVEGDDLSAVPEPATLLLVGLGVAAVAARRRFFSRK